MCLISGPLGEKKEIGIAYMEKERSLVIGEKIEVRTMMVGTRGSGVTNGTRAFSNAALPAISSRRYLLTFFFFISNVEAHGKWKENDTQATWSIALAVDNRDNRRFVRVKVKSDRARSIIRNSLCSRSRDYANHWR